MDKTLAKELNDKLFEIQYNWNGLYGYYISYRMVSDNNSFQVQVFHHGNKEKVLIVKNIIDIDKVAACFDK